MIPPIKGFIKSTLLDWEGRVASLIFLPGCNFRCPMCHSPHLVGLGEDLETVPLESVLEHVTANRGWIDGLAITGGEPTLQPGIIELLELLRGREVPVKLDTNGSRPDVLEEILQRGLVEAIAMDHIREKIASFISSEKTQKVINDDYCELRLDVYVATPQEFWRIVQAEAERIVYLFKRIKAARNEQ